jgi:hypothetical protein
MDVCLLCVDVGSDICRYLITRSEGPGWICASNYVLSIDFNNEAHYGVILTATEDRDITLHTKMNYCTRCWCAIQTITNTICTLYYTLFKFFLTILLGLRGGVFGWRTTLLAERSMIRFAMGSFRFFMDLTLLSHYGTGVDSAPNRKEYQEYLLGGIKAASTWGWQPYHVNVPIV